MYEMRFMKSVIIPAELLFGLEDVANSKCFLECRPSFDEVEGTDFGFAIRGFFS